jgi:hypothetical protein
MMTAMNGRIARISALGLLLGSACGKPAPAPTPVPAAHLARLSTNRTGFHAYGQAGDLVVASGPARFVFASKPDPKGHKPLRGALLDATVGDADVPDPLLFFRQGWEDGNHKAHVVVASAVEEQPCARAGSPFGVRVAGDVEGVGLTTTYCPLDDGKIEVVTTATNLPAGAFISDELNPGTAEPSFEGVQMGWEGEHATPRVTLDEYGLRVRIESDDMIAARHLVHIANESFPSALFLRHKTAVARRTLSVTPSPPPTADRALSATIAFSYADEKGAPLPVQVVLARDGDDGAPAIAAVENPTTPVFVESRSVYLPSGRGSVRVAPGSYRVVTTHGPTHTLATTTAAAVADKEATVSGTLSRVVDTTGWTSADFHLHSAPSADSRVSLEQRVSALACVGVDFAASTDHNRITDYAPAIAKMNLGARLSFTPGDEITTPALGHFNVFPMPLPPPGAAPELVVPPYYELPPGDIFKEARSRGARIVEVNHARMPPRIGYFDLTHFDARNGTSDAEFSTDFDSLEVHNGFWLEHPDRVREGVDDLVGLARRGKHVAAVGNSDSHKLFFEEAGWPRTYVRTTGNEPLGTRVISALLRAETTVSAGPFVEMTVDGRPIGSLVAVPKGKTARVHVRVQAPAWIPVDHVEIHVDDDLVRAFKVEGPAKDGVRFEGDADVPIDRDVVIYTWVDAERPLESPLARKGTRAIGITGLAYVDADGDGAVTLKKK